MNFDAWQFILDTFGNTWAWLSKWSYHGVTFGIYIIGYVVLSILIDRIFN